MDAKILVPILQDIAKAINRLTDELEKVEDKVELVGKHCGVDLDLPGNEETEEISDKIDLILEHFHIEDPDAA